MRDALKNRRATMALVRRFIRWLSSLDAGEGLDTTEYVERIEREFEIVIPAQRAESLVTLGDLCDLVARERRGAGRPLADQEIWERVRRITSEEFGIREDELHPGIRYVDDLHC